MIVHDLKDHVLCSQCRRFRYGLGPYQCKRGHMICSRCQPVTDVCPQCFIFVDVNDPIRCHFAVDILMDKVPVPCVYKMNGCMVKAERGLIRQHVLTCPFGNHATHGVANLSGGIGTTDETVTIKGGASNSEGEDDDSVSVLMAGINNQNENIIIDKFIDIQNEHNYIVPVLSEGDNQNEGNVKGVRDDGEKALSADIIGQNEEPTVSSLNPSLNVQHEQNSILIVLSDDDDDDDEQIEKIISGVEARGSEDVVVKAMVAEMNDQNEKTVGGGTARIRNELNPVEVLFLDEDDHNEESSTGAGDRDDSDFKEKATAADMNDQNEHGDVQVIVLDQDSHKKGPTSAALVLGNENGTKQADMNDRNMVKVSGTEGSVAASTDDTDNMEVEDGGIPEDDDDVEGDNDTVQLAGEDEGDIGMEVEEVAQDPSLKDDDNAMNEENLGSLAKRKGTRKRMPTQRYSPQTDRARATTSAVVKAESEKDLVPISEFKRRTRKGKKQLEVTKSVSVDPTAPEHKLKKKGKNECKPCGKHFSSWSNLMRHNETHHQLQRPFECNICGHKFRLEPHVTNHLVSFHSAPVLVKNDETEEIFTVYRCCMFCDNRFVHKENLRNHLSNLHRDNFEISCGSGN